MTYDYRAFVAGFKAGYDHARKLLSNETNSTAADGDVPPQINYKLMPTVYLPRFGSK